MIRKGKVYKVWIEIEEYDVESEDGTTMDVLFSPGATFRTADEALEFARALQKVSETLPGRRVKHR